MMKFRRAVPDDAQQLAGLAHELNLYHGDDFAPDTRLLREHWNRFEVYIVETDGKAIGFLAGYDTYQFHTATPRFEVQDLHVSENYRRQGLGRLLIEETIALKKAQGIKRFSLGVIVDNTASRQFYKSIGFEERPAGQSIRCFLNI